jgi:phage gp36-like protein
VLTEVVNGSEAEADSYIAKRYLVPVAVGDHPALAARMKSICLDLSVYHLLGRGLLTEDAEKAYEKALEWLKAIAKGEAVLPSPDTEAASESDLPQAEWGIGATGDDDRQNRVFTRDSMSGL